MTNKQKLLIVALLMAASFAAGRYLNRQPEVKTTEQTSSNQNIHEVQDTHTTTTVVAIEEPNGEKKTTTTTNTDTITKIAESTKIDTKIKQEITPIKANLINVSLLAGFDARDLARGPIYGASVTKQIFGPISAGLFGLTDGTLGVSVGWNF